MNDLTVTGNLIEAGLWLGFALIAAGLACRASGPKRRWCWIMAAALLVFGFSDLIESKTGAWWEPMWLLVLKASCLAVLVYGGLRLRAIAKAQRACHSARPDARLPHPVQPAQNSGGQGPAAD